LLYELEPFSYHRDSFLDVKFIVKLVVCMSFVMESISVSEIQSMKYNKSDF